MRRRSRDTSPPRKGTLVQSPHREIDPLSIQTLSVVNDETVEVPILFLHGFATNTALNWVQSGWVRPLGEAHREAYGLDLPGMGDTPPADAQQGYRPSSIRARIKTTIDSLGVDVVDVVGYSFGSRLAWEFAAENPQLVRRLVLAGCSAGDPLARANSQAAREALEGVGVDLDPLTAEFVRMMNASPGADPAALVDLMQAVSDEPYTPAQAIPTQSTLLLNGERDPLGRTAPELVRLLDSHNVPNELVLIPGRNHANTVTSRVFKEETLRFLSN